MSNVHMTSKASVFPALIKTAQTEGAESAPKDGVRFGSGRRLLGTACLCSAALILLAIVVLARV